MKYYFNTIVFLIFFCFPSFSQQEKEIEIKKKIATAKEDTNKVNLILDLSNYYFKYTKYTDKELLPIIQPAIDLSKKINYSKGYIKCSFRAALYCRMNGIYDESFKYIDLAEKEAIKIKDSSGIFNAHNSRGSVYWGQGVYSMAAEEFFKALEIAEILKDKFKLSQCYNNIGNLYVNQENFPKGIVYHLKALKYRIDLKDSLLISHSYVNLGEAYCYGKQFDSSLFYYSKALQIQIDKGNKVGQAYSYEGIANGYYFKEQYPAALSYYKRAFKFVDGTDDISESLLTYIGLGRTYLKLGSKDSALKYFNKSKLISERINKLSVRVSVYNDLAEYYELTKDYEKAFNFARLHSRMKDSLYGTESAKKISSIEYQHQIAQDKKIQELEEMQTKILHDAEVNKQKLVIYSFILGFIIVIVFSFYVYRSYKQKAESNRIITLQKEEVEKKNELIEEKQKEILDSIHYAKRIQNALLAHKDFIDANLLENFVLFKPKDIVSGDFYWAAKKEDKFYIASCDSTGHGVPGAFMSLLNIGFLSEAIKEKNILEPNKILNYVRERLITEISSEGQKDGFDGILISIDKKNKKIEFAAANNAPVVVRDGKLIELQSDRMPVGKGEKTESFTLFDFDYKPNDIFYLYTDGYPDQFGGPKGKKFLYKRFNELLLSHASKSLEEQKNEIDKAFGEWKGDLEQIDDVCIIGIKM